jgi:hypothetical protein
MSFIRIVRPGEPVRPELFVDLGYSRGRMSGTSASMGGPIVVVPRVTTPRVYAERPPRPRDVRCGAVIPRTGNVCGRPVHNTSLTPHRSTVSVARDNAKRRARRAS